jgi:hypothetical protein
MIKRTSTSQARAFDAAGPSGKAFLISSLSVIDPIPTRPLQAQTYERDITVRYGGGYSDSLVAYSYNYGDPTGGDLASQGTNTSETGMVDVDIQQGSWKYFPWAKGFFISTWDLNRMKQANDAGLAPPISLQELYDTVIHSSYEKFMDRLVYLGRGGQPGLVNNTAVAATTLAATGQGSLTTWASKTPVLILNDVNTLIQTAVSTSGYDAREGMPNRMLIPLADFTLLSQPMTTAGSESTIEYIERSNIATRSGTSFKINWLPDPWIAGQGVGATNRSVVYRNDPAALDMIVAMAPQIAMTVPTSRNSTGWETTYHANVGQVRFKRPTTAVYGDGI